MLWCILEGGNSGRGGVILYKPVFEEKVYSMITVQFTLLIVLSKAYGFKKEFKMVLRCVFTSIE